MKLKALRSFFLKNNIRGCMEQIRQGQEFTLDTAIDSELIDQLVRDLKAEPIDAIPERARYTALCSFSYQDADQWHHVEPKGTVSLDRPLACRLMAEGKIRPDNVDAWYPGKLSKFEDLMKSKDKAKRMFDAVGKVKNWVADGVKK